MISEVMIYSLYRLTQNHLSSFGINDVMMSSLLNGIITDYLLGFIQCAGYASPSGVFQ